MEEEEEDNDSEEDSFTDFDELEAFSKPGRTKNNGKLKLWWYSIFVSFFFVECGC